MLFSEAMGKTWDEWSKEDGQSIRRLLDSSLGDGFVGKWTDEITMRVGNSVCESLVDCVDDKSWNEIREDILTAVGHKSLSELFANRGFAGCSPRFDHSEIPHAMISGKIYDQRSRGRFVNGQSKARRSAIFFPSRYRQGLRKPCS